MIQWEYLLKPLLQNATVREIENFLDVQGLDGWELCQIEYSHFIFKRQKQD